jgi:two-component system OmpR family response regulator
VSKGHILVVDDEQPIRDLIHEVLTLSDFQVTTAADGLEALNVIRREKFDLILLDVNLPKIDGFSILERVRESAPTQPIIMISARVDKDDVTHGLRLGADDYIRKPFGVEELVLRVENRLKRNINAPVTSFSCGPITLSEAEHKVTFNNELVDLSPTEFNLLLVLIENENRVLSKEKLLQMVWDLDFETTTNVVDTYISYLRKKLHKDGYEGIKTIRGVGYKLERQ